LARYVQELKYQQTLLTENVEHLRRRRSVHTGNKLVVLLVTGLFDNGLQI